MPHSGGEDKCFRARSAPRRYDLRTWARGSAPFSSLSPSSSGACRARQVRMTSASMVAGNGVQWLDLS